MSLVLIAVLLAGCAAPAATQVHSSTEDHATDPVVVAVIDSGLNPYLDIYRAEAARFASAAFGGGARSVMLSDVGDFDQRVDADAGFWSETERGVLYHFGGTRLAAISFAPDATILEDRLRHGAFTAYLAARDAPDVAVVLVQVDASMCKTADCLVSPTIADAMEWVALQDWIDIVSISLGVLGNVPDHGDVHPEMARYVRASREAAASGKLIVNGAGNDVVPGIAHYFNGPPWIVAVGGVEPAGQGEGLEPSRMVDVVSNYAEHVPAADSVGESDRYEWTSGTSFATPIVAGTLAQALHLVREAGGNATSQQLRDAMNASAVYFNATDWNPVPPEREGLPWDAILYSSLPIVAQAQMGWGYVNGSLAPEIARRVLAEDFSIPAEKDQAMLVQPAWQRAREEFWARWG